LGVLKGTFLNSAIRKQAAFYLQRPSSFSKPGRTASETTLDGK